MGLSPNDLILTTFRDLTGNWVRSALTTLGIFMGVAAVNATLNIEAITAAQIDAKLAQRDNPFVTFGIWARDKPSPELGEADFFEMQQAVPNIAGVSRRTNLWNVSQVRYQAEVATDTDIAGVTLNYQQTTGRQLLAGRFFQQSDFDEYYPVTVINSVLAEQLFPNGTPIGQGIFLDTIRVTVIGVVEAKLWRGDEPRGEVWLTQNYADAIAGRYSWGRTQLAIGELANYQAVEAGVQDFLEQRYQGFNIWVSGNAEDLYKEEQQQRTSALILKVVGLLALVIGGVGIANITIAAVMERTREIGLRRAIGATDWEVMLQFVVEAALLSVVGGTAAIATVHGLTIVATTQVFEAPYTFRPQDAAISMGAAFVVGVGASFLPALRVTQIDIVQALRGD